MEDTVQFTKEYRSFNMFIKTIQEKQLVKRKLFVFSKYTIYDLVINVCLSCESAYVALVLPKILAAIRDLRGLSIFRFPLNLFPIGFSVRFSIGGSPSLVPSFSWYDSVRSMNQYTRIRLI